MLPRASNIHPTLERRTRSAVGTAFSSFYNTSAPYPRDTACNVVKKKPLLLSRLPNGFGCSARLEISSGGDNNKSASGIEADAVFDFPCRREKIGSRGAMLGCDVCFAPKDLKPFSFPCLPYRLRAFFAFPPSVSKYLLRVRSMFTLERVLTADSIFSVEINRNGKSRR